MRVSLLRRAPPPPTPPRCLPMPLPAPPRATGVGGLLDILFEDSLEGYVGCVVFGLSIIGLIRALKLPVVEGNGLGF